MDRHDIALAIAADANAAHARLWPEGCLDDECRVCRPLRVEQSRPTVGLLLTLVAAAVVAFGVYRLFRAIWG